MTGSIGFAAVPVQPLTAAAPDATESQRLIAALKAEIAAKDERFWAMLNVLPEVVWSARPDGYHDFYNDRWYEFTGAPQGTTDGEGWNGMFHPDDQPKAWEKWRHSIATGDSYEIEYRLRHRSGEYRWTLGRAVATRDADGDIERWFGTCTDIHDLKIAEEQRELITQELAHRIKNIFAVISSLVALTARGNAPAKPFADALRSRISALAKAHDYVRPHSPASRPASDGQTVLGLITTLLAAYADDGTARISIAGDDALIGVGAATSLALVIHELATNAIKYGALSADAGLVAIDCVPEGDSVLLSWRESGGPHLAGPPKRQGFGSTLSQRAVTLQLDATITNDWRPEGLAVSIAIPQAKLQR